MYKPEQQTPAGAKYEYPPVASLVVNSLVKAIVTIASAAETVRRNNEGQ